MADNYGPPPVQGPEHERRTNTVRQWPSLNPLGLWTE
jgi:hypothetical protein